MAQLIIDYDILFATSTKELVKLVKSKISEGWQPVGRPFSFGSNDLYMRQEIVLYQKKQVNTKK